MVRGRFKKIYGIDISEDAVECANRYGIEAEAKKIWAEAWNGHLPEKVLPEGSDLILDIN